MNAPYILPFDCSGVDIAWAVFMIVMQMTSIRRGALQSRVQLSYNRCVVDI